jgi:hypothetical protein
MDMLAGQLLHSHKAGFILNFYFNVFKFEACLEEFKVREGAGIINNLYGISMKYI